jgi:RNA-directed DNA polymerase
MNGYGQSDGPVVPADPPDKAARAAAEVGEERGPAKGDTAGKTHPGPSANPVPGQVRQVRWNVCVK